MNSTLQDLFITVGKQFANYLPNLFAGIALIGAGWLVGWTLKRVLIQVCIILRLGRMLGRFRWGEGFAKADVRYALYNAIGNIAFAIVFLIFLNAALDALRLTLLSDLIKRSVLFVPRLLIALLIFGLGLLVAARVSALAYRGLAKEEVPRATLIARFLKAVLLLFFSAMALVELDIAREIVVIGFTVTFVTLALLTVTLSWLFGKDFAKRVQESFRDESRA